MKNINVLNTKILLGLALMVVVLAAVISGCSSAAEIGESQDASALTVSRGEHERDSSESGGEHGEGSSEHGGGEGSESGGEESGTEYGLDDTYDVLRNGVRLVLVYDAGRNAFVGTVENTTKNTLPGVRVEVHLSNGTELGPTTPVDLGPGEKVMVLLPATSQAFNGWSAHPEVGGGGEGGGEYSGGIEGAGEHGSSGESGGEHDSSGEGGGEHGNGG